MGSNWLCNSSPQGEVARAAGRRGSAEGPLTPSVGFADSSPWGEQFSLQFLASGGETPGRRGNSGGSPDPFNLAVRISPNN
jgi:hypothetical protein